MLQITKTEIIKRGQVRIWINDEPAFRLSADLLKDLDLKEGQELEPEELAGIHTDILLPAAKKRCLDLLLVSDKTRKAVLDRLIREEYPEDVALLAVEYAENYHYIDDLRYACSFIHAKKDTMSSRRIRQKLLEKGVSSDQIEEAFSQEDSPDEAEQILYWIRKKGYDSSTADQKETERLLRFLIRKGYSYADIRNTLEKERIDTTSFNV